MEHVAIAFYVLLAGLSISGIGNTALRNHMRIVFDEMSSWIPLTMYLWMKTTFWTKYVLSKYGWIFIMMIFDFHNIIRKCILTLNSH